MKTLITPAQADTRIFPLRDPFAATPCPLELAGGGILRQDIVAGHDFPPFDRVMMDGIAVRMADIEAGARRFRICGTAAAGQAPALLAAGSGNALEVMTGAVLPTGADCILPCEWYREEDGGVELGDDNHPRRDDFIHRRGSDHLAGDVLVRAGVKLGPVEISVAAACGCAELDVSGPIRLAVIATGDELVPVGAQPGPGQIRQTNVTTLRAALLLAGHPAVETGHLRDEPQSLRDVLAQVFARNDVVILTGGVSKGRRDHVPEIVGQLGGGLVLHGVAQRPGRPMAVWAVTGGPVVVGLPGNPVSALVCLHRYVIPALDLWSGAGARPPLVRRLADAAAVPRGLTLFLPVIDDGTGSTRPRPVANSGDFAGLVGTTGFVELNGEFAPGDMVPYFHWASS